MFVHLVVSTLILGSVVAVPPPTAAGDSEITAAVMTDFRCTLMDYEENVKLFMDNVKVDGQPLDNATAWKFYEKMKPYIALLPKAEGRLVTKKYREKCWCDGSMRSPCPEKCMNSCIWTTDDFVYTWKNENDCEGAKSKMTFCFCYRWSSTRCHYGNLSNCYEERTELEQVNETCSHHHFHENILEKTLPTFFNNYFEPLRGQLRTLADKVSSLKQAVMATDSLFNFTSASCCEEGSERRCYPKGFSFPKEKLYEFVQLKKNITTDMILIQENAASVTNKAKRITISQILGHVKDYECCLKGLGYSDKDNECEAPGSPHSTLPSPWPPSPTTS